MSEEPQDEKPLQEEAMTVAVEQAAAAVPTRPTNSEIKDARHRAEEMLRDPEVRAGMKDMQNLALAIGLPAARIMLCHLVEASGAVGPAKAGLLRIVERISPITEPGCMRVDFFNQETKKGDVVYLELDECDKNHDLDSQLGKLKPHVEAGKWSLILNHLSVLILHGRSVFSKVATENSHLMGEIKRGLPEKHKDVDLRTLTVDRRNTTLYVLEDLPRRIGIFVRQERDEKTHRQ